MLLLLPDCFLEIGDGLRTRNPDAEGLKSIIVLDPTKEAELATSGLRLERSA